MQLTDKQNIALKIMDILLKMKDVKIPMEGGKPGVKLLIKFMAEAVKPA